MLAPVLKATKPTMGKTSMPKLRTYLKRFDLCTLVVDSSLKAPCSDPVSRQVTCHNRPGVALFAPRCRPESIRLLARHDGLEDKQQ